MTSVWKNVFNDKLDDIVNDYSSPYHSTIKVKPVEQSQAYKLTLLKKIIKTNLDFKLVIM